MAKRFMVVFSSSEAPMVICSIHDYADSMGESYGVRVFRLEEDGLMIFEQMQTHADMLMPATDILAQVTSLISRFAEENNIAPEDIYYAERINGNLVRVETLHLHPPWTDPTFIRQVQKRWISRRDPSSNT